MSASPLTVMMVALTSWGIPDASSLETRTTVAATSPRMNFTLSGGASMFRGQKAPPALRIARREI